MSKNDEYIERWLQQDISDEKDISGEDCSDIEPDVTVDQDQAEECESESEIEGDDDQNSLPEQTASSRSQTPSRSPEESDSSEDDIPLSRLQSRATSGLCKKRLSSKCIYIPRQKVSDGQTLPQELKHLSKPTQAVLRLITPIENSNRNVTADNWFSSIELVNCLKQRRLSFVGTLKKNKREISSEFKPSKKRPIDSSVFGFTKDITLSSYVPKKNKAVVLISSMHHTASVDQSTQKPEIILYYNHTKIGVDLLNQRCSNYSTSRRTRRWPLNIFYRLLDISSSYAYIIYCSNQAQKTESRFKFLKWLAQQLTKPHMERREKNDRIPRDIKNFIRRIFQIKEDLPSTSVAKKLEVRKTCLTCDPKKEMQNGLPMFRV
ncbi:PiggyBac transposable element-derived protein 4 [Eumeta japonica]|uniref:PiggyBac transposable element-derived protein 4 n=1 Tax=Eumeta variegata TaxID=151549 RepID=A0A4C1ZXB7_EUMVA|nr:PiggyBac transposable element-derived protein 4 [Eumeta japonica]